MSKPPPGADERCCRSCGKRIWFMRTTDGKTVPLDPVPPVYELDEISGVPVIERTHTAFVSHFATCRNPAPFSGRNRSVAGAPKEPRT